MSAVNHGQSLPSNERAAWGRIGVGFDLGDTLCEYAGVPLNWEREYPAALTAVAAACGHALSSDELGTATRVLSKYNTRLTPRDDDVEYGAEQIFSEILASWSLALPLLQPAILAFFCHFRRKLRPFPEAAAVLKRLAELGVPMGVLTDVPYGMPRSLVEEDLVESQLALTATQLITSTMVGHRKPHPAGFRALAKLLDVPPADVLYVGNEQKDVAGSVAAGMQAVLLWRSHRAIPDWGQAFTIRSLDELLSSGIWPLPLAT